MVDTNYKVGDYIQVTEFNHYSDEEYYQIGKIYKIEAIEDGVNIRVYETDWYDDGNACLTFDQVRVIIKATRLAKKLYPNYKQEDGWIIPNLK